jgi:hypothetical protein
VSGASGAAVVEVSEPVAAPVEPDTEAAVDADAELVAGAELDAEVEAVALPELELAGSAVREELLVALEPPQPAITRDAIETLR